MADLQELKAKYQSAVDLGKELGVQWKNIHIEEEKLLLRGLAPNQAIKNKVWTQVKTVDPEYADLTVDLTIDESLPVPLRHHTVAAGENLSKISNAYYGTPKAYMTIFNANRDQLSDPNKIRVGQVLKIPALPEDPA